MHCLRRRLCARGPHPVAAVPLGYSCRWFPTSFHTPVRSRVALLAPMGSPRRLGTSRAAGRLDDPRPFVTPPSRLQPLAIAAVTVTVIGALPGRDLGCHVTRVLLADLDDPHTRDRRRDLRLDRCRRTPRPPRALRHQARALDPCGSLGRARSLLHPRVGLRLTWLLLARVAGARPACRTRRPTSRQR